MEKVTHRCLQRGLQSEYKEIAGRLRCLCPCKIPSQPGFNEISELELQSREFTQLIGRDTSR